MLMLWSGDEFGGALVQRHRVGRAQTTRRESQGCQPNLGSSWDSPASLATPPAPAACERALNATKRRHSSNRPVPAVSASDALSRVLSPPSTRIDGEKRRTAAE